MRLPHWLAPLATAAALITSSALCAGWKWDHLPF
jgi:hypothetical protein